MARDPTVLNPASALVGVQVGRTFSLQSSIIVQHRISLTTVIFDNNSQLKLGVVCMRFKQDRHYESVVDAWTGSAHIHTLHYCLLRERERDLRQTMSDLGKVDYQMTNDK